MNLELHQKRRALAALLQEPERGVEYEEVLRRIIKAVRVVAELQDEGERRVSRLIRILTVVWFAAAALFAFSAISKLGF